MHNAPWPAEEGSGSPHSGQNECPMCSRVQQRSMEQYGHGIDVVIHAHSMRQVVATRDADQRTAEILTPTRSTHCCGLRAFRVVVQCNGHTFPTLRRCELRQRGTATWRHHFQMWKESQNKTITTLTKACSSRANKEKFEQELA